MRNRPVSLSFSFSSSLESMLIHLSLRRHSLDGLLEGIWQELALVKIYTKKRGDQPDLTDPICMRRGSTIEVRLYLLRLFDLNLRRGAWTDRSCRSFQHVCHAVHRSIASHFRFVPLSSPPMFVLRPYLTLRHFLLADTHSSGVGRASSTRNRRRSG